MSISTQRTDRQTALSPYALNRRQNGREGKQKDRGREKEPPPYVMHAARKPLPSAGMESLIDPGAVEASLKKVERSIHGDPASACKSQTPARKKVRDALRT